MPANYRLGDLPEVKALYEDFELKLKRLHSIACLSVSAEEYARLKKELNEIYARILAIAGSPERLAWALIL